MSENPVKESAAEVKPSSAQAVQPVQSSSNSTGKVIIACCAVLLVLVCLCCGALSLMFGATISTAYAAYSQIQTSLVKVCDGADSDLRDFYNNYTTSAFRAASSLTDFKDYFAQYKDIVIGCSDLKSGNFLLSKINGLQINTETTNGKQSMKATYMSGGYTVTVVFYNENGNWKLNSIDIN